MIKTDLSGVLPLNDLNVDTERAEAALKTLESGSLGHDGWRSLPEKFTAGIRDKILGAAADIIESSSSLVVIGVGGSYLGARAVLEALRSPEYNLLPKRTPNIYFAGTSLSARELSILTRLAASGDFSVNVISKSGSTLESSVAFRVFRELLNAKYGEKAARRRIYVTTDAKNGALRRYVEDEGIKSFDIPPDIGGRYSVLTSVGLLPLAVAGIDPERLIDGARREAESGAGEALKYAAARTALYKSGKAVELLASFEPGLRYMGEWWKQLFGESEGKNLQGIFPAYAGFTTDLHSMGQYIQCGTRNFFETLLTFEKRMETPVFLPRCDAVEDGLENLGGRNIDELSAVAERAVKAAHISGNVPVIEIKAPELSPEGIGALVYFFETACAVSAITQGVNPFDQPGVETYKRNIKMMLGL